ncbi:hypothetical protein [Pseudotenacibaculum haliotis]|uniref:Uncharacterized protein n=1 Tax=Pseudotenacibaculum haliotis TaxID=1862138 RepID=A0ABW5LMR1_9FLAO
MDNRDNISVRSFMQQNEIVNYDQTLYDAGIEWIENFWHHNKKAVDIMSQSKIFWNWWSMQWERRTEPCIYKNGHELNETNLSRLEKLQVLHDYNKTHSIGTNLIYPTDSMLDLMKEIEKELKPAK